MNVVGYVRASIEGPVDLVADAPTQERTLRAWARARRHRLTDVVVEPSDGGRLEERVGFAEVLQRVRDGSAAGVVVARLDRIAFDLVDQELLLADLRRAGRVWSAAGEEDLLADPPDDPIRALVRRTIAAVPAHTGAMRALRVRHRLGKGPMPADVESAALRRIEELSEHGATLGQIARALSAAGFSPKHSHIWDREGLRRIVERLRGLAGATPSDPATFREHA